MKSKQRMFISARAHLMCQSCLKPHTDGTRWTWFVPRDTVVDFPGRSHKIILVRPLCLGRNYDKYLQNDPLEDPPQSSVWSSFRMPGTDHVLIGGRLQAAICSKYFLIANVTDLTVYFPRYISSKVIGYEYATLRKLALWLALSWEDGAVLTMVLIWWRSGKHD